MDNLPVRQADGALEIIGKARLVGSISSRRVRQACKLVYELQPPFREHTHICVSFVDDPTIGIDGIFETMVFPAQPTEDGEMWEVSDFNDLWSERRKVQPRDVLRDMGYTVV